MTEHEEELAELYGEAAKYSDFSKGDHIAYRHEGLTHQGTILWVAAPTEQLPTHYVVIPDGETDTFPHLIMTGEVIGLAEGQEPILRKCPFCTGSHPADEIELCPLNPNR